MITYEQRLNSNFDWALREGSMHFEKESAVHMTLRRVPCFWLCKSMVATLPQVKPSTHHLGLSARWRRIVGLVTQPAPGSPQRRHRKACKRYNIAGNAHALTFSCFRRQPFLSKDGSCRWLIEAIDRARGRHSIKHSVAN